MERALHRGDGSTDARRGAPAGRGDRSRARARSGVGCGRGGRELPEGGRRSPTSANIDYLGDYVRSPDGNLYFHNGLNRNDIFRVSRDGKIYLFAGNGTKGGHDRRRRPGQGRRPGHRAGARRRARRRADRSRPTTTTSTPRSSAASRPDGSKIETIAGTLTASAPLGDGKPALRGAHRHRQRHDRRARRHDLLDRALQPARQLEGPPAQARAGRHRHHRRGRRRQAARERQRRRPRSRSAPTPRAWRSAPTARSTSRCSTRRRSSGSTRPAASSASRARASRTSAADRAGPPGVATPTSTRPISVAAGTDGNVYIRSIGYDVSPSTSVILRVDENGVLQQYAGRLRGTCGAGGIDGEGATSVCMQNHSMTIGVDGDSGVTFADGRYLIRKVAPPLPGFDADGPRAAVRRRLPRSTSSTATAATCAPATASPARSLETFEYDAAKQSGRRGRRVRQPHADRARRRRQGAAIVAPGGQRTALTVDSDGLARERHQPGRRARSASPTTTG